MPEIRPVIHELISSGAATGPARYECRTHSLLLVASGDGELSVSSGATERVMTVAAQTIWFLRAGSTFAPLVPDLVAQWVGFEGDLGVQKRLSRVPATCWSEQQWQKWWPLAWPASEQTHSLEQMRLHAFVLLAVSTLLHEQVGSDEPPAEDRFRRALSFMDANFVRAPSLEQVAASEHLSPAHFHRAFRAAYAITPREYMQKKRLQLARNLVATTDRKLADIADACGFDSPFYLSRVFKSTFGVSPQHFRAMQARQGHGMPTNSRSST